MTELRTDFAALEDGARIVLHPTEDNPLHRKPVSATYQGGYFYCDGSDPIDGPDYYLGDVATHNHGFVQLWADSKAVLEEHSTTPGWWCKTCQRTVPGAEVTFEETHDIRAGGCGEPVAAIEGAA